MKNKFGRYFKNHFAGCLVSHPDERPAVRHGGQWMTSGWLRSFPGVLLLLLMIFGSALFGCLRVAATAEDMSSQKNAEASGEDEGGTDSASALPEELTLYATSAVLLDADSGRVLYEKNGYEKLAMASTTKIMTCILALEYGDPDAEVEISSYAAGMPKVKLFVQQGESYSLRDLLYSMMLESHNDSAVAIAEYIGTLLLNGQLTGAEVATAPAGSVAEHTAEESKEAVAAFAALMNEKARELGYTDTWFITPNGLDATETFTLSGGETMTAEHSTTAADLAGIMAYCIRNSPKSEAFLEITGTISYSFTANGRSFSCTNHNAFLTMMEGALSGKTGYTNKAGYCYVGALESDGRTFVVALLACGWPDNRTYKWSDTRKLMEYGMAYYSYHDFSEDVVEEEALSPLPVIGGQSYLLGGDVYAKVAIRTVEGETEGLLLREDEGVQVKMQVEEVLLAPVTAGDIVGNISYLVNGTTYRTDQIIVTESIPAITFRWCIEQIVNRFLFLP